jgi:hypothetical protein
MSRLPEAHMERLSAKHGRLKAERDGLAGARTKVGKAFRTLMETGTETK